MGPKSDLTSNWLSKLASDRDNHEIIDFDFVCIFDCCRTEPNKSIQGCPDNFRSNKSAFSTRSSIYPMVIPWQRD